MTGGALSAAKGGVGADPADLRRRVRAELTRDGGPGEGDLLVVALSGGVDSLTLLHVLRFSPGFPSFRLHAAHFDHGMREGSGRDAAWVRGVCRSWGVPLSVERAEPPPVSEEGARVMRYGFLLGVREALAPGWLLTAHHADDQAETVLFRVLRGTGLRGLAGIPGRRAPGIVRPLLPITRRELESYARAQGLRAREDPSNLDPAFPRNYIRQIALPGLTESVAPGARKSLVRLSRLARENEEAWSSILPSLQEGLTEVGERGLFIVRSAFLAYHPAVQTRLLRELLREHGVRLDEAGTRALLEFTRTGASGRVSPLPGGLGLTREFDRFLLGPRVESEAGAVLEIPAAQEGHGRLCLGGRNHQVRWGPSIGSGADERVSLSTGHTRFPLLLRGWASGDRIRLPYGSKKLKKLFGEAGIPAGERGRVPVLVDGDGQVLWAAGVAVSDRARAEGDGPPFFIGIDYANQS